MRLSIKDPETERLARDPQGAARTLRRVGGADRRSLLLDDLAAIRRRCAELPVLDPRAPEDIIGYDECGIPR